MNIRMTIANWLAGYNIDNSMEATYRKGIYDGKQAALRALLESQDVEAFTESAKTKETKKAVEGMRLGFDLAVGVVRNA